MRHTKRWRWLMTMGLLLAVATAGCSDDDVPAGPVDDVGVDAGADAAADAGPDVGADAGPTDAGPDVGADVGPDMGTDAGDVGVMALSFTVRMENTSDQTDFPTLFAPGAWAVHPDTIDFFPLEAAASEGLERLAEDADPTLRVTELGGVAAIAAFGSFGDGPLAPGQAIEFEFEAAPADGVLSLASMLGQSNDLFVAPADGIPLFDSQGEAIATRDVSDLFELYNAGTERDEAPAQGPNQAPRQPAPDTGPIEGVVARFSNTTRALPLARDIVEIDVSEAGGTFTITLTNVSAAQGALTTPIAPVFWAIHDPSYSLFDAAAQASSALERLAEDGTPNELIAAANADGGVLDAGAQNRTVERPTSPPGAAMPGESFQFEVTPDADHPLLSFAAMVVESNDAFLAPMGGSVVIFDNGAPRTAAEVEAELISRMALWDAGTERNQTPGAGVFQPERQNAPNTGPVDPVTNIRLYRDATNDLEGPRLGDFVEVSVSDQQDGSYEITIVNTSNTMAYQGVLTPVVWALHSDQTSFFQIGAPASLGIERIAEDGDASVMLPALQSNAEVLASDVANIPDGESSPGPLSPGDSYTFTVTPDADHRFLSIASMVVPSNDTFMAFEPAGVALLDASGAGRSEVDIAADIVSSLAAWDAGTELNQAGASGPDQAPRQAAPNTGPSEGDGTVRLYDVPGWSMPMVPRLLRVTVGPTP